MGGLPQPPDPVYVVGPIRSQLWQGRCTYPVRNGRRYSQRGRRVAGRRTADTSWELHRGDWRLRFRRGFPRMHFAAYLISFDPYMFDRHAAPTNPNAGNMRPGHRAGWSGSVGSGAGARRTATIDVQRKQREPARRRHRKYRAGTPGRRLKSPPRCHADGNMMSMVFARDVPHIGNDLQDTFKNGWST